MPEPRAPGTRASVRALGRTLVAILQARLELLAIEGTQLQHRAARLALLAGLGFVALLACVLSLAGLAVASFWDTPYRLAAIAAVALLFAVAAVAGALAVARALRAAPPALEATFRSLAADLDGLA